MRAYLPGYEMKTSRNLPEALTDLGGGWIPFAGGTDLMVQFEAGRLPRGRYLNILKLKELQGIQATQNEIRIGALSTYTEIQRHPLLRQEFPMLVQAAAETGAIAIQNQGTLGGNIANASPAADSPPALLAYGAKIHLISASGERHLDYSEFHLGYKKLALLPGELVSAISLPRVTSERFHYYRKIGTRKAQAISKVCFAGVVNIEGQKFSKFGIALGSVAPLPLKLRRTEQLLAGRPLDPMRIQAARSELLSEIAPIDDIRSTKAYRATVAANLLEEFLQELSQRGKS